jgi:gamma-glutamyltranspeptidase / glutathione hydrolase
MHHQWLPDRVSVEPNGATDETIEALRKMGHDISRGGRQGDAHSIWVAPDGAVYGIPDNRTADSKASVPPGRTSIR